MSIEPSDFEAQQYERLVRSSLAECPPVLTVPQAAKCMGMCAKYLRGECDKGNLRNSLVGRSRRIPREALVRWLVQRQNRAA